MKTVWDLFRDMESMRRGLDTFFSDGNGVLPRWAPSVFRYSFLPGRAARAYPLLNVSEDEENLYVDALAPGLNAESLGLNVVNGQLTISGEKPALGKDVRADAYHRNERAAGRFTRTVDLPGDVDQDKARADYTGGILRVTLPKSEAAKPRMIAVKTA